jgi:uncharacterized membrane-anchored protein YjiN (DUF445 family)
MEINVGLALTNLLAQCYKIYVSNPRVEYTSNPFYKEYKKFLQLSERLTNDEKKDLANTFYSTYYIDAISELPFDWIERNNVILKFEDVAKLNISACYRVALELDENDDDKTVSSRLRYYVLNFMRQVSSDSISEKLDEFLVPLAERLGLVKKPKPSINNAGNPLNSIMNNAFSAFGLGTPQDAKNALQETFTKILDDPSLRSTVTSQMQQYMQDPATTSLISQMTNFIPEQYRNGVTDIFEKVKDGSVTADSLINQIKTFGPRGVPEHECEDGVCMAPRTDIIYDE